MAMEEESIILKLLRDPACPKILVMLISIIQLLVFCGIPYDAPVIPIILSALTFLASIVVMGLVTVKNGKGTELVGKFCVLKGALGKKEIGWNSIYRFYTLVFGFINFLSAGMTLAAVITRGTFAVHHVLSAILSFAIMGLYFVEAYKTYGQNTSETVDSEEEIPKPCALRAYMCLVSPFGRFPIFFRLIVIGIAIARTVCIFTIYPYWYFYDYDIHGFQFMMHFIAGLLIFGSVVGILVTKAPCFKRKIATFTSKNFVDNEILYVLAIFMLVISFFAFGISFAKIGRIPLPYDTIFFGVTFLIVLFMALANGHAKNDMDGFKPVDTEEQGGKSFILPKNLAKTILNPVAVPDELKNQLVPDEDGNPYIDRPLFRY